MLLTKLEIQGFKSFAQKIDLEFPAQANGGIKGITAIVGPNGSGKSNIAESFRWVLGEQSLKALRSKKSEDIIFSGSDKKARLGYAEVSLFLDNSDGQAPIDYSEVVITRKLYRSGESDYLINNKKARLQDILMLLAKASFGQRTYSIIGQGMVDSFLIMSQQEKKEFFDEAAGIKQYQIKRDDSINKLRLTEENLHQAEVLLNEISPRLKSLTRQVRRLERREEIERELREKQQRHFGGLWREIDRNYQSRRKIFEKIAKEKEEKRRKNQEIENQLNVFSKQLTRGEIFNKLQQEYQRLMDEKNRQREKEYDLKHKIAMAKQARPAILNQVPLEEILKELEKLEELIDGSLNLNDFAAWRETARQSAENVKNLIKKIRKREPVKPADTTELEKNLAAVLHEIKIIEEKARETQDKISEFNKQADNKNKELFELQQKLQKSQNELYQISERANQERIELAKLETKREDLTAEIHQESLDINGIKNYQGERAENAESLFPEIQRLKHQMELIGGIDPEVQKEYGETGERYEFLSEQSTDLRRAIKSLETIILELDEIIKKQFNVSFNQINEEFQKYFKILFGGGTAKLIKLKDEEAKPKTEADEVREEILKEQVSANDEDGSPSTSHSARLRSRGLSPEGAQAESSGPSEERLSKFLQRLNLKTISGIEIQAVPPGKKVKTLNMLSGGERAMTTIALICAIISSRPSPFVILDEVDAALDEANSQRFSAILDELSHKTQFVIITHNRASMHKAKILYGVTMGDDGISRLLSLKLEEAEKYERS